MLIYTKINIKHKKCIIKKLPSVNVLIELLAD